MLQLLRNTKVLALVGLLVIGIALGAAHNRAIERGRSFLPEDVVQTVMRPFQFAVSGVGGLFEGIGRSLRSHGALRAENRSLRAEVKRLSAEVARLREEAGEARRLRAAIGFKEEQPLSLLAARVISRNPSEWFVTATISRGRTSGVRPGQAVVTPWGLLGQVFESSPFSAQVRGLTDRESGVGAMVQRSRAVGICRGQDTDLLHLSYLAKDADIRPGDIIITSGQGGIVPKGLPIGRVVKVQNDPGGFTKFAAVRPSVKFDRVEEVFVVIGK